MWACRQTLQTHTRTTCAHSFYCFHQLVWLPCALAYSQHVRECEPYDLRFDIVWCVTMLVGACEKEDNKSGRKIERLFNIDRRLHIQWHYAFRWSVAYFCGFSRSVYIERCFLFPARTCIVVHTSFPFHSVFFCILSVHCWPFHRTRLLFHVHGRSCNVRCSPSVVVCVLRVCVI